MTKDSPLVVLESDKATLDVPSPQDGTIRELKVAVGDRVSVGTVILTLEDVAKEAPALTQTPTTFTPPTIPSTPALTSAALGAQARGGKLMRPVWNGEEFQPRLILPLMLSWDHRVVDGVAAAR